MTLLHHRHHNYVRISLVNTGTLKSLSTPTLPGLSGTVTQTAGQPVISLVRINRVIYRDHDHTIGPAKYSDIITLLVRNGLWTNVVNHNLTEIISKCPHYLTTSAPAPTQNVSLPLLIRPFNETVCIDHFYIDEIQLFNVMDSGSRYLAVYISDTSSMKFYYWFLSCMENPVLATGEV